MGLLLIFESSVEVDASGGSKGEATPVASGCKLGANTQNINDPWINHLNLALNPFILPLPPSIRSLSYGAGHSVALVMMSTLQRVE